MITDGILSKYGFTYSRSCNCDGYSTKVYSNSNGLEFRWRKNRFLGKLKKDNTQITNWFNIENLELEILAALETV